MLRWFSVQTGAVVLLTKKYDKDLLFWHIIFDYVCGKDNSEDIWHQCDLRVEIDEQLNPFCNNSV